MKSDVNDYLELMHAVYEDACIKCSADVSDLRDLMTIRARVRSEGLSFVTITLPNFCKDFERSLELGFVDPTAFSGFPRVGSRRRRGAIPAFLQGMLGQLFDRETGRILDESSETPTLVESIRQVCLLYKKVELSCTPERDRAAIENFIAVEHELQSSSVPESDFSRLVRVGSLVWDNTLAGIQLESLVPRHGPGATAEGISGNQKYVWERWHERLEPFLPFLGGAISISAAGEKAFENVAFVPEDQEQPVKVTLVPKTLKSPRIIAIEPVCMQYAQQAVRGALYRAIESADLTGGQVNFTDQSVNQKLALVSSSTGLYATIDLSDASDRVPRDLALELFGANPDLKDFVDACRSKEAELPDGRRVRLEKFASMGSALCFPVESMYFYTICVAARLAKYNLPLTHRNVARVAKRIFVYGDDLIVPRRDADVVLEHLQKYKCKVNTSKSFWTGKFRESCGVDAYAGYQVTPVYLRKMRPKSKQQASQIVSWVATANLFYKKGYWRTATLMYCICERVLGEELPYVSETSSLLGRISVMGFRSIGRWNSDLHLFEKKGLVPTPVYSCDHIDGYSALQKCLLTLEGRNPSFVSEADAPGLLDRQKGVVTPFL
uniref:RNA-directed RNA polymerase n=1 Tax=Leviviridae sp. TaxID=2027243 RepID=A0A514D9H2_9VIRU|nr:MAG: RNA-dependent RNA polymerase [Leviviridae sp.]